MVATLDQTDHAYVAVFDHGKPRAAMKAVAPGGLITVSHDDGLSRASMSAKADYGSVVVVNSDMKVVGELTSKAALGSGGALLINTPDGRMSIAATTSPHCGLIAIHDAAGKLIHIIPGDPNDPNAPDEDEE